MDLVNLWKYCKNKLNCLIWMWLYKTDKSIDTHTKNQLKKYKVFFITYWFIRNSFNSLYTFKGSGRKIMHFLMKTLVCTAFNTILIKQYILRKKFISLVGIFRLYKNEYKEFINIKKITCHFFFLYLINELWSFKLWLKLLLLW